MPGMHANMPGTNETIRHIERKHRSLESNEITYRACISERRNKTKIDWQYSGQNEITFALRLLLYNLNRNEMLIVDFPRNASFERHLNNDKCDKNN